MRIGITLKELRIEAGLTQKQLAQKLGIGQSTIVGYERELCDPTIENLIRYANYFNFSLDYFLGRTDEYKTSGNTFSLSGDEQEILALYNGLRSDLKEVFWIYLRALSDSTASATKKKLKSKI